MKNELKRYARVLTIAGSDSGGGAGVQADLKTFSALGCYGTSVITALTAQNTKEVQSIYDISPKFIGEQLSAVLSDIGTDAIKIGMLHRQEIVEVVADYLKNFNCLRIVVDPVMVAKSGDLLLKKEAIVVLKKVLLPLATVLTPNLPEASVLLGMEVSSQMDMERAAQRLLDLGPSLIVVKGGHSTSSESSDFICFRDQNGVIDGKWLQTERIRTKNTHGTGCTLSSAIASYLAKGFQPVDAVEKAKNYLTLAIESGANYKLGAGHGPVNHFFQLWKGREDDL